MPERRRPAAWTTLFALAAPADCSWTLAEVNVYEYVLDSLRSPVLTARQAKAELAAIAAEIQARLPI